MKIRNAIAGATTLAVAIGLSLTGTLSASAAASNCASGYTCFWGNTGYKTTSYGCSGGGDWVRFQYSISDFTTYYYCLTGSGYTSANDRVASVYNNGTQCSSGLYVDAGFGTIAVSQARQTGWSNLAGSGKRTDLSSGQFIC